MDPRTVQLPEGVTDLTVPLAAIMCGLSDEQNSEIITRLLDDAPPSCRENILKLAWGWIEK
jgi:hypothetical protein